MIRVSQFTLKESIRFVHSNTKFTFVFARILRKRPSFLIFYIFLNWHPHCSLLLNRQITTSQHSRRNRPNYDWREVAIDSQQNVSPDRSQAVGLGRLTEKKSIKQTEGG